MNKMTVMAAALVILALFSGAYVLNATKSDNPKTDTASPSDKPASTPTPGTKQDTSPSNTGSTASQAATLSYTNSGFNPIKLAVKVGTKLTISNDSTRTLQFESGPHPEHTDHPEMNIGLISAGDTATITMSKPGTYSVHNHLNASHTATIVVE